MQAFISSDQACSACYYTEVMYECILFEGAIQTVVAGESNIRLYLQ